MQPKRLEPGEPVPDFTMTGQDGKPFKLSDLRGHVVVLTFIYTRCPLPDFCPLMDRKFADLAQTVAAFPRRAEDDPPDLALVRPGARHAGNLAQACPDPRGDPAALDLRRRLARGTGQGRRPAGAGLRAGEGRNHS